MKHKLQRLSGKEFLILEMLVSAAGRESYGMELTAASNGQLARGTVYVTLGRMEDKGLVESRREEPGPGVRGVPRRLYRPTAHGARMFTAYRRLLAVSGRLSPALGNR
ncbi:MAG: PadR family transcriptional regulator [Gemmatimonadales bacterium]